MRVKPRICMIRSNGVCPDSRVEKEAVCLMENSYEVTILAWDRDSDHTETLETLSTFGFNIPIVRFGIKAEFGKGMKSLKQFLKFQRCVYSWLRRNRGNYDIIHACDFDTALTASIYRKLYGKKLVFDIFDFLYCTPKTVFERVVKWIQYKIIDDADATIICTEERKKQIEGSHPRNLTVIHNTPPRIEIGKDLLRSNDKIKVCYVGILQDWRLLEEIPYFFIKHPEVELHIGGFGKFEVLYKNLSSKYSNIKFYGRMLYDQTLKLEASCDIMLAIYAPCIDNHVYAAPNKFYESLMLAKPVVMVKGTGMSSVVELEDIGVNIDYSIDGFEKGIEELISRKCEWAEMSERMLRVYNEKYSWEEMKVRFLSLYSRL